MDSNDRAAVELFRHFGETKLLIESMREEAQVLTEQSRDLASQANQLKMDANNLEAELYNDDITEMAKAFAKGENLLARKLKS